MSLSSAVTSTNTARVGETQGHSHPSQQPGSTSTLTSGLGTSQLPPGPLPTSNTWAGQPTITQFTQLGPMPRDLSDPTGTLGAAGYDPTALSNWYNQVTLQQQLSPLSLPTFPTMMPHPFNPLLSPNASQMYSPVGTLSPTLGGIHPGSNPALMSGVSRSLEQYNATLLRNQLDQSQQQSQVRNKDETMRIKPTVNGLCRYRLQWLRSNYSGINWQLKRQQE